MFPCQEPQPTQTAAHITTWIPVMQCPLGFHLQAAITPANPKTDVSGTQNEQTQQEVEKRATLRAC